MRLGVLNPCPKIVKEVGHLQPFRDLTTRGRLGPLRSCFSRQVAVIQDRLGVSGVQGAAAPAEKKARREGRGWH